MNEIIVNLEGKEYQIDIQKAKDLGILKEKDTRCKSWEEFKLKHKTSRGYFYESTVSKIHTPLNPCSGCEQLTQQEAIAIQAFSKLLKLRRDWIGDWEPDWNNKDVKYSIKCNCTKFGIGASHWHSCAFVFPTQEMAKEFLECFKDLFEQCKNLI
jgi:hypothetical protein